MPKSVTQASSRVFDFPRRLKLNQAIEFKALFKVGRKKIGPCFSIFSTPNSLPYPRLGMVIAKKAVRQAVERNRIKRVIRESFRIHRSEFNDKDVMVVAYRGIAELSKQELREQIDFQWPKSKLCAKV